LNGNTCCKALDEVGHHDANHAEEKQRCRVLLPVLRRRLLLDSAQAQKKALDRAQGAREGPLLAFEHAVKVDSQRLGKRENHQQKECNLKPTVRCHGGSLETLRFDEGVDQVHSKGDRKQATQRIVETHDFLLADTLEFLARLGVEPSAREEADGDEGEK
jgi:hypothetical protein